MPCRGRRSRSRSRSTARKRSRAPQRGVLPGDPGTVCRQSKNAYVTMSVLMLSIILGIIACVIKTQSVALTVAVCGFIIFAIGLVMACKT